MDRKSRNSVLLANEIALPLSELRQLVAYHIVFNRDYINNNGIECLFLPLNSRLGLKIYPSKRERDKAFASQKIYFKKGVAPAVGKKIDISLPELQKDNPDISEGEDVDLFCYTTQIAKRYPWTKDRRATLRDIPEKDRVRLVRSGMPLWDFHEDNIGIIDNEIVFLDFGVTTCPPKRKCKNKK